MQPWGTARLRNRLVLKRQQIRVQRFAKIRADFDTADARVLARRSRILALSFHDLRGTTSLSLLRDHLLLIDELQNESISASDALDAYIFAAFEAQIKINCVIDFLFESVEEARTLDAKYRGRQKPPLFGVPFSVKGNFHVRVPCHLSDSHFTQIQGYDCSIGLSKFLFQPVDSDCSLITFLRSQGAIPFVHTNIPQALISFVCSNAVYGTTGNPHNPTR